MKKIIFFTIILFLAEPLLCNAININEIMYNPEGNDNNKEFIEIYIDNNETQNLTSWIIGDESSDDTLELLQYNSTSKYALITEEGFDFSEIRATIYSAGASIGNNLGNSADSIYLYDNNGTLMDSVSYDGSIANGNSYSIEFSDGEWLESCDIGGTPGKENCNRTISIPVNNTNSTNTTNTTNTTTIINSTECKPIIVTYTDNEIYNSTDKVSIYFALYNDSFPYTIEYWIEDSIGNIIKSKYNTTNTNKKSWTPKLNEIDGVFFVKTNLYLNCGQETKTGDSESMFIVLNSNIKIKNESGIIIKEVYLGSDDKIEFGKALRVNAEIFKGDESKSTVEFWVENSNEKISQTSKALFYDKFTEYDITLPIQLKPNCDKSYKDGTYTVVIEGFDLREEETINIEGITSSLCKEISSASSTESSGTTSITTTTTSKIDYQLLNFKSNINSGEDVVNELLIQNDNQERSFDVWSYIYRGSKSYSGEREENKQRIELSPGESAIIEMNNIIDDAEPGDYKFKVKIKKDSQKTNQEITREVKILETIEETEQDKEADENKDAINKDLKEIGDKKREKITGQTVYEGSAAKSKQLGLVFLLVSVFLISLIGLRTWMKKAKKLKNRGKQSKNNAKKQQKTKDKL